MATVKEIDFLNRLKSTTTTNVAGQVLLPCSFPEGDAPQSPGLGRGTRTYPGLKSKLSGNPEWVVSNSEAGGRNGKSGLNIPRSQTQPLQGWRVWMKFSQGRPSCLRPTLGFEAESRCDSGLSRAATTISNATSAVYQYVTNLAVLNNGTNADIIATNLTGVFLPPQTETLTHDDDGNLLSDGRWTYTWDAENRLVQMQSLTNAPFGSKRKLEFGYDLLGRRVWKKVTDLDASQVTAHLRFVYDGWSLLAELNATNGAPVRTYVWGSDLSGTMQGAGGVGGLLMVDLGGQGVQFVAGDGNGNITALVSASTSLPTASYEYGPFGEAIRATGILANSNPFRFSSNNIRFLDGQIGGLGVRNFDFFKNFKFVLTTPGR